MHLPSAWLGYSAGIITAMAAGGLLSEFVVEIPTQMASCLLAAQTIVGMAFVLNELRRKAK